MGSKSAGIEYPNKAYFSSCAAFIQSIYFQNDNFTHMKKMNPSNLFNITRPFICTGTPILSFYVMFCSTF